MMFGHLPLQADELVSWGAGAMMAALVGAIVWLVLNRAVRLPRLMELGMTLVALGVVAAAEPVLTDYAGDHLAIALRWCLLGSGLGLIMLSWVLVYRRRLKDGCPMQRVADSSPIELDAPVGQPFDGEARPSLFDRWHAWRLARRTSDHGSDPTTLPPLG